MAGFSLLGAIDCQGAVDLCNYRALFLLDIPNHLVYMPTDPDSAMARHALRSGHFFIHII